jgi:hypothetical protein
MAIFYSFLYAYVSSAVFLKQNPASNDRLCLDRIQSRVKRVVATSVACFYYIGLADRGIGDKYTEDTYEPQSAFSPLLTVENNASMCCSCFFLYASSKLSFVFIFI